MTAENNKATALQWYESVFNGGNLELIEELFAANFLDHDPGNPLPGYGGLRLLVSTYRSAFPDLHLSVEDMIAEGDKIVTRFTGRGTHKGPLLGMPPTDRKVTITAIDILRFDDGKIVEHWGNQDLLGMMQQLGMVPVPAQAS